MGLYERSLTITGQKSKRIIAFFDSGSSFTIINKKVLDEIIPLKIKKLRKPEKAELGNGSLIYFRTKAALSIKMNGNDYWDYYFVSNEIPEDVVIGVDFLQKYGHTLEFKNDKIRSKNYHLKNRRGKYVL